MKKKAQNLFLLLFLSAFIACQDDDSVQPMQEVEAKIGESFTITAPSQLSFTNLEGIALKIEVGRFADHIVKGLVSPRTYADVSVVDGETTTYQIETGYSDTCYGQGDRFCNELSFEVKGQPLLLKFEEVYWSKEKENSEGVGFIAVDSVRLIVERR